jgi:hypothetical protein
VLFGVSAAGFEMTASNFEVRKIRQLHDLARLGRKGNHVVDRFARNARQLHHHSRTQLARQTGPLNALAQGSAQRLLLMKNDGELAWHFAMMDKMRGYGLLLLNSDKT